MRHDAISQTLTYPEGYGSLKVSPRGTKANQTTVSCGTKGKENWTDVPNEEADPPYWNGVSD
jgi:hypothetical protein